MLLLFDSLLSRSPVVPPIDEFELQGFGDSAPRTRRRLLMPPTWLPEIKTDDDEALLMILGVF